MSECVTLGTWSKIFVMLRALADRKVISSKFGISQVEVCESWRHIAATSQKIEAT